MKKSMLAAAILISACPPVSFALTERDMRNQGYPQQENKRGKFKRRTKGSKK